MEVAYTAEETPEEFRLHIDVADPEDVCVDVDEDTIRILAPASNDEADDEGGESGEQVFSEIPIPDDVDADLMEASMEHGHLDIIIPRRHAEA